jgi:hypothetical protein
MFIPLWPFDKSLERAYYILHRQPQEQNKDLASHLQPLNFYTVSVSSETAAAMKHLQLSWQRVRCTGSRAGKHMGVNVNLLAPVHLRPGLDVPIVHFLQD